MTLRVSIVVPSFNEPAQVIAESFASIRGQSFPDFECIVVDESTDLECAETCRDLCTLDPRFIYIRPASRLGLAGSLNLGVTTAKGDLIARFDSDDVCMPDRLSMQVHYLDTHPDIGVLGGALELFRPDGRVVAARRYPLNHAAIVRGLHTTTTVAHPTVMMRKHVLDRLGGYDPTFRYAEDVDLWLRLANAGVRFANLPTILVRYRQQSTSRHRAHWTYSIRARIKNLAWRHALRRIIGILGLTVWSRLPPRTQEMLFARLLLKRADPRA